MFSRYRSGTGTIMDRYDTDMYAYIHTTNNLGWSFNQFNIDSPSFLFSVH